MVALIFFVLSLVASPFKPKSRLEAENAALRHQVMVLQRKVRGAVASALIDLGANKSFYTELAVTFGRSLGGLALGAAAGNPIGAGMALSPDINGFFGPLVKT